MRKIAHFWRDAAVFFEFLKIAPKWRSEEERIRRARRPCPCYGVPLGLGDGLGLTAGNTEGPYRRMQKNSSAVGAIGWPPCKSANLQVPRRRRRCALQPPPPRPD